MDASTPAFLVPGALLLLFFVIQGIRYGGPRAALIDAKVRQTNSQVIAVNSRGFPLAMKVSALESSDPNKAVAIEFTFRLGLSFSWTPLTLSKKSALALSDALQIAAE